MLQIQPCPERVEGRAERTNAVVDKLTTGAVQAVCGPPKPERP
jgi:hypothetical protein